MPPITTRFIGKLDLDNSEYRVKSSDFIDAFNVTSDSQGDGQDMVLANIKGNRLVNYALPSGVNKVIGTKEDLERNRVYSFVWNSNGNHTVKYYDGVLDVETKLFESKTNSGGVDILGLNPSFRINHIDIIYRSEGDLIFFTDGQDGNIFCLDVTFIQGLVNGGTPIKREYIQMAKQTSEIPPFCFYENDLSVTINNLRKNLFKFKLRYSYNDLAKSITSSQSTLPLPVSENVNKDDASKNAKISIAVPTGEKNVVKVEILAAYNLAGGLFSDYFTIKVINKSDLGLADNDVYVYAFYNNEAYINIDVKESTQQVNYVPQVAFTQANANGNTIEYANIVEGYDNTIVGDNGAGSDKTSFTNDTAYATIQDTLEFGNVMCYQGGNSGYITDINNGNITIVFFGTFVEGAFLSVFAGSDNIQALSPIGGLSASAFMALFQAAAVTAGYTIVSSSGYNNQVLVIHKNNTKLLHFFYSVSDSTITGLNYKGSLPVYDWWSRYQFGIVYFDEKDRTNGVVFPIQSSVQSDGYGEIQEFTDNTFLTKFMYVDGVIWNKPPTWANYYHIVRTKNLAKGFFVQWISDITLKEVGASAVDNSYAYIGINPLNAFIAENTASSFLGYSFVAKDRIRFIKDYQSTAITYAHTGSFVGSLWALNIPAQQAIDLNFSVGDIITISGTTSNNVTFTILSLFYNTGTNQYQITATASVFTVESFTTVNFLNTSGIKYASKDFEILALVTNPTVNGVDYVGSYVKIILPTTSTSFDFGSVNFYNYFFELYRPTVPTQGDLNLFYEFGERYMIANAGTTLALHQGKQASQTVDGGGVIQTAAVINSFEGDDYGRYRDISVVPILKWFYNKTEYYNLDNSSSDNRFSTILINKNSVIEYGKITQYNQGKQQGVYPPSEKIFDITTDGLPHTYKISLNIRISNATFSNAAGAYFFIAGFDNGGTLTVETPRLLTFFTNISNGEYTTTTIITIPANTVKVSFLASTLYTPLTSGYNRFNIDYVALTIIEQNKLIKQFCIDPNYSDYFQSAVNSNGRAWIHDINAKRQHFPTTIRFSQEFQQNTNINKTSLFYEENLDDYDRSKGDIMKLFVYGRYLDVYQQFDVGVVPILQQIIKDTTGNPLEANSDKLLNKIQYPYQGKFGIGNVPESFTYYDHARYFIDNFNGLGIRLSQDGMIQISNLYECDAFFTRTTAAYDKTLNNGYPASGQPYLGNPTILGGFDKYTNKAIWAFEEINRYDIDGNLIFHQDPKTIVFNEKRDESEGFECFTNYFPEAIQSLGTLLVTFKNGKIWLHDSNVYCNFYGTQFKASITPIFRGAELEKKEWTNISQVGSVIWTCPLIYTQTQSYQGQKQESNLIAQDFVPLEGSFEASFLRDIHSINGILDGDKLKGIYIVVKFELQNATSYQFINEATVRFIDSPLTTK